jgi:hypothetical protein
MNPYTLLILENAARDNAKKIPPIFRESGVVLGYNKG